MATVELYYVYIKYDSGDHEKGYYRSPLFSNRRAAENFLEKVRDDWKHVDWHGNETFPWICQEQAIFDKCPDNVDPDAYLNIVYT